MWSMLYALSESDTQNENSTRDHVCSVLCREKGLLTKGETWGKPSGIMTIGRQKDAKRHAAKKNSMNPSCCDGKMMKGIGSPKQFMVGQKNSVVTWTPSRR